MSQSIYSLTSHILKRITGIKDFSLWRKNLHKKIGKIFYKTKYTAKDIVHLMADMGMVKGSVVCIHSSMKEFYNYVGTPEELIEEIINFIGEDGTLVMPAFPIIRGEISEYIFDPRKDKTGAGLLAETFRMRKGVLRSNNVQHSVCAYGKYAEHLLRDHTSGFDCWDEKSPWYRMTELGALVFNFGLPRSYMGTFHHCVESVLKNTHPYWAQFFKDCGEFHYIDEKGEIFSYNNHFGNLTRRTRKRNVTRYFSDKDWQIRKLSNLEIKVFYTRHCFPKMLELGKRGISVYYEPSPSKYEFPDD